MTRTTHRRRLAPRNDAARRRPRERDSRRDASERQQRSEAAVDRLLDWFDGSPGEWCLMANARNTPKAPTVDELRQALLSCDEPAADHALRTLLSLIYGAANQWNNAYIDREKVDAALRDSGIVDAAGEVTEFGRRYGIERAPAGDGDHFARRDAEAAARAT